MKNKALFIRLSEDERAMVEAMAKRDDRNMSDTVRRLIRQALS